MPHASRPEKFTVPDLLDDPIPGTMDYPETRRTFRNRPTVKAVHHRTAHGQTVSAATMPGDFFQFASRKKRHDLHPPANSKKPDFPTTAPLQKAEFRPVPLRKLAPIIPPTQNNAGRFDIPQPNPKAIAVFQAVGHRNRKKALFPNPAGQALVQPIPDFPSLRNPVHPLGDGTNPQARTSTLRLAQSIRRFRACDHFR